MDKATGNKAVIAKGAQFKGKVKNARSIDINGSVEADLKADKVTIGENGEFSGAINAELVVISGQYDGNMDAGSIWATASAQIAGKIQYKTLQMDRGAALNCRVIHNWKSEKTNSRSKSGKDPKNKAKKEVSKDISPHEKNELESFQLNNDKDPSALKMLSNAEENQIEKSSGRARGRRLGIFGFATKTSK